MPSRNPTVVDLFCGAGGMALGFHQAGFKTVLGLEIEEIFAKTFKDNFKCPVITAPIERAIKQDFINIKADVVIGGSPCQGFSNLNGDKALDPRRSLWRYFMDVVESSK